MYCTKIKITSDNTPLRLLIVIDFFLNTDSWSLEHSATTYQQDEKNEILDLISFSTYNFYFQTFLDIFLFYLFVTDGQCIDPNKNFMEIFSIFKQKTLTMTPIY